MPYAPFTLEDILADQSSSDAFLLSPVPAGMFRFFRFFTGALFFVVALQVVRMGVFSHAAYAARAAYNTQNDGALPAPRGVILDRFKESIVRNEKVFRAFLLPRELPSSPSERDRVFRAVGDVFGTDRGRMEELAEERVRYFQSRIMLSPALSEKEMVRLSQLDLPGVLVEEGFRRVHADPFLFSHVVGYTGVPGPGDLERDPDLSGGDEIGKAGLERYYDEYLRGKSGAEIYFRDAVGNVVSTKLARLPQTGSTVQTFLDAGLQEYFYGRLTEALRTVGGRAAVGIAMNPQNGEVLSLVSIPSFDTENISDSLEERGEPFFNRAVGGRYTPGSTIKLVVALAALTEGVITPSESIYSAGFISIPRAGNPERPFVFKDWKAHGAVDVVAALARSSNVYFYEVGGGFRGRRGLGISRLKEWLERFRLHRATGIDMSEEAVGALPSPEWKKEKKGADWFLGDTYNVSIGQGDLLVTPIALLNSLNAIANGGSFYKPRLMKQILSSENRALMENPPLVLDTLSEEAASSLSYVRRGLRDAVKEPYGTAYLLRDLPFPVSGKTGSSQIENNEKTNAFFIGYGPSDDPQISVLVIIEDAVAGSLNAVPVAKDVFGWYYENRLKADN